MRHPARPSSLSNTRLSNNRSNRFFFRQQTLLAALLVLGAVMGAVAVGQPWSVSSAKRGAERASGGENLLAAAPLKASLLVTVGPTLGNYPNSTVALSGEVTVTPDAAPTGATGINVSTSTDFKGTFSADLTTGVVRVTNAHPAGTYTVTVRAFDSGGLSTSGTFTLTVQAGTACAGTVAFTNAADSSVGTNPQSVAVGDFNNDGKQDIAAANFGSDTVSIRLGDGAGGFSGTTDVSVGTSPSSVAVGDFNNDGRQDIAAANSGSNTVSIRLVDGLGGFSGTTDVSVGTSPSSVAVGDFNSDGRQDIAAANNGSNTVSIRLGDGLGGFSGTTDVSVGNNPYSVAVGDFNSDGRQDIAAANLNSNTVSIRLGDGLGGFSGTTNVSVGTGPRSVAVGDFNNDGKQDFAAANLSSATVSIRLGDGLGGFSGTTNVSVGNNPQSVAVGDFNNDGKQDFAAANYISNTVSIRLGDGLGGFSGTTDVSVGTSPSSVAVGDFNNDGKQDFAAANSNSDTVSIRLAAVCSTPLTLGNYPNTTVSLGSETTITPDAAPTNATGINVSTSTDFKGTFAADPVTGVVRVTNAHPAGTYTVTVRAFNGTVSTSKTFTLTVQAGIACAGTVAFTNAADSSVGTNPQSVAVGDFNNDGRQDIAAANASSNTVSIRLGDGLGGFSGTTNVTVGTTPYSVAVGDFNNDGKQDIAAANRNSNSVSIRLGDGAGGFSGTTDVTVGSQPISVAVGDFNGDGKQDIATANYGAATASIRLGDGAGGFGGTTDVSVSSVPYSVAVGDFNNDGKQDIAAANLSSNTVSIRLGDGLGGFSGTTNVSVGNGPVSVAVGDFNGDGKQDIATANYFSTTVSIRLGDGAGGFSGTTNVPVGSQPISVAVGDFNNDGKQDIAAANNNSDTVSIRLGDGAGGFSGTTNVPVGNGPYSVAVGDFNNDGKQDIAAANQGSFTVSIRLGSCNLPPTITATSGLSRQQGTAATNSQIATVTDDGGNGNVAVTVTSANPSNGVTISNIINSGGNITANIAAGCTATDASFTLQASDGTSTATATLNITVTANTAPTLTYASPQAVAFNGSTTVTPTTATDNGSITGYAVQSVVPAMTTAPTVNASGVVSITNAQPAGAHTITIRATDDCGLTTDASFTLNVSKADQTITFGALSGKTFGNAPFTVSATGGASGNAVTFSTQTPTVCTVSGNTVTILSAGTCTIRASQAGNSNYNAAPDVDQSFTVAKANQTITFGALSNKTFGDSDFNVSATSDSNLTVSFAASGQCTVTGTTVHITGAGTCKITASQAGDGNYNAATPVEQTFTINKATPTITWSNPADITYGTALSATQLNATASVAGTFVYTPASGTVLNAGNNQTLSVNFTPTDTANYNTASKNVSINVLKANQTITFGALSGKTFGDAPFTVSVTGGASGNPVTFSSQTPTVCSVSGNTVTILSAGTCTIRASQTGNNDYNAAPDVDRSFTVAQAATTTALSSSATPSSPGQSVTFTATVNSGAGTPTGTVTFKDGGTVIAGCTNVALSSGQATCSTSTLTTGSHTITADYSGDANFTSSTGTLSGGQQVNVQTSLSINDVQVQEGNSGTTNAVFTVTLSAASNLTVSVSFATANGTAAAPSDYQSTSGTLTFSPGDLTKTVTVLVNGDTANEGVVTFFVNLSGAVNATISDDQGKGTILNDDATQLQFSISNYTVGEADGHATITVLRTGDTSQAAAVDYATSDLSGLNNCNVVTGNASQRCDYTAVGGTLSFIAGQTSATFEIPIINDVYVEGPETLSLTLSNPTGGILGAQNTVTLTITDNDLAPGAANPIDDPAFFIRQHYLDFLNRQPDGSGLQGWLSILNNCPAGDKSCDRIGVSSGFFRSPESFNRTYYIYRFYRTALGRKPSYDEYQQDIKRVTGFLTDAELEARKAAFAEEFVQRAEFRAIYDAYPGGNDYVNAIVVTAGVTPSNRTDVATRAQQQLITRGRALRELLESPEISQRFYNEAFVVVGYFAYLRRDPDALYLVWIDKLNNPPAGQTFEDTYREMIRGFIQSLEYGRRFGQ